MNDIKKLLRKAKKWMKKEAIPEIEQFFEENGEEITDALIKIIKDNMAGGGDLKELKKTLLKWLKDYLKAKLK